MPRTAADDDAPVDEIDLEADEQGGEDDELRDVGDDSDTDDDGEGDAGSDAASDDGGEGDEDSDGQLVITLGDDDESEPEDEEAAPTWVKNLRKENRAKDRRIRDLERQVQTHPSATQPLAGPKPTLEACGGDHAKYETEFEAWSQRKAAADVATREQQAAQQKVTDRWNQHLASVDAEERRLGLPKVAEARETFEGQFSVLQQAIVLKAAKDPRVAAIARYNLAHPKNARLADRLSAIGDDPVEFTIEVGKVLEEVKKQMKATKKPSPPAPERRPSAGSGTGSAVDNTLAKLRKEAEKTGDLTKLMKFKKQQRQKAA